MNSEKNNLFYLFLLVELSSTSNNSRNESQKVKI